MSVWFRNPDKKIVSELGYWFWLTEGYSFLTGNVMSIFIRPPLYDMRWWVQMPLIPLWYIITPVLVIFSKKRAISEIKAGQRLTVSRDKNIKILKNKLKEQP